MPEIPKSIKLPSQLFQQSRGSLKTILKHSQTLIIIQSVVRTIVPGEIYVALFSNGLLHLTTPSAALATKIKYSQQALFAALRRHKNPFLVKSLKISVRPEFQRRQPNTRSAIPISAENGRHIAAVAKYIEDEPLRKALIALSKRTE